jgi:hypothetical protein
VELEFVAVFECLVDDQSVLAYNLVGLESE